jgi:hypothetical protein
MRKSATECVIRLCGVSCAPLAKLRETFQSLEQWWCKILELGNHTMASARLVVCSACSHRWSSSFCRSRRAFSSAICSASRVSTQRIHAASASCSSCVRLLSASIFSLQSQFNSIELFAVNSCHRLLGLVSNQSLCLLSWTCCNCPRPVHLLVSQRQR